MSYQEFQDAACKADGEQYEKVGMTKVTSSIRHRAILERLDDPRYEVVLDLGAGYGNMWFNDYELLIQATSVIMTDADPVAVRFLNERFDACQRIPCLFDPIDSVVAKLMAHDEALLNYGHSADVVVSCGALNYYGLAYLDQLFGVIAHINSNGHRLDAILEINLQSPQGDTAPGAWQPSIASLYDLLYTHFLSDGKSSVEIQMIKKFTAIVHVKMDGTAVLAADPVA